ncbi:MAG: putative inorganic carbon transporter subunit DabA [Pseudomonadota bacterium]
MLALIGGFTALFESVAMRTQSSIKSLSPIPSARGWASCCCNSGSLHLLAQWIYQAHALFIIRAGSHVGPCCAAFIAAPRDRSNGIDLQGRAFLHSYSWKTEEPNGILEHIMTAPILVASWIRLHYYGSSIDNNAYCSGDKMLHNMAGGFGIQQGAGGDLRSSLPVQSVHDGDSLFHPFLRLTAVIQAPTARIDKVLEKHAKVLALFNHQWLHLIAITEDRETCLRHQSGGT